MIAPEDSVQILIVADPQMQAAFSYEFPSYITGIVEYYWYINLFLKKTKSIAQLSFNVMLCLLCFSDIYMRRYFYHLQSGNIKFENIFFLGDIFDGVTRIMRLHQDRYFYF